MSTSLPADYVPSKMFLASIPEIHTIMKTEGERAFEGRQKPETPEWLLQHLCEDKTCAIENLDTQVKTGPVHRRID